MFCVPKYSLHITPEIYILYWREVRSLTVTKQSYETCTENLSHWCDTISFLKHRVAGNYTEGCENVTLQWKILQLCLPSIPSTFFPRGLLFFRAEEGRYSYETLVYIYQISRTYIYMYIYIYIYIYMDRVAQSVWRLSYGLDGPGSNPGGDEIFRLPRPALRPTQSPVKWVPGLFRGLSAAGACCWPLTPFQCHGHGRVELYLYPPSGPHQACNGNTLPLLYIYIYIYIYKVKIKYKYIYKYK